MDGQRITSQALDSFEAFPPEFDALIGQAVRAFGILEREISLLTLYSVRLAVADGLLADDNLAGQAMKKALNDTTAVQAERIQIFAHHPAFSEHKADLRDLVEGVKNLLKFRALICHCLWFPVTDGVTAIFYSRAAIAAEMNRTPQEIVLPDQETFRRQDLEALAKDTLHCAEQVAVLSGIIHAKGSMRYPSLFPTNNVADGTA